MTEQQPPTDPGYVIRPEDESNTIGLIGLILSILGLLLGGVLSPISLILSVVGLFKPRNGTAIAGLIISIVGCLSLVAIVMIMLLGIMMPSVAQARKMAHNNKTISMCQQVIMGYKAEHGGALPSDEEANENLLTGISMQQFTDIRYEFLGPDRYELRFAGKDGQHGTSDDDVWICQNDIALKQ
ncbi:MAG: hypothetical protein CMJ32_00885 [Phycisphaerae bacterium]|nr:hypothetical protein [Phycisphaerae bacterium]